MQSSKSLILSLLILFQSLCWSHQSPIITYISPQQIKETGERVQLVCIINDVGNYSPSWSKRHRDHPSDSLAMAIKTTPSIGDDRYNISLESNSTTTKYIFEISDIQSSDMGIYECQVITSSSEKITSSVELLVRHPPIISETQTTSVVTVAEGKTARLTCIAEGYPRPRISWKREYNAIMPTGGQTFNGPSIEIKSAHKTDRGMYYCIADNGVGSPDQKSINLEVEFAPKIRATRPKVAQALHYDVELECKVEAYPPPSVFWFKDGVQLTTNRDYRITQMATTFEITNSILRVLSVDPQNYGDYFCNATNKMGHDAARLNLFESDIAVLPFHNSGKYD